MTWRIRSNRYRKSIDVDETSVSVRFATLFCQTIAANFCLRVSRSAKRCYWTEFSRRKEPRTMYIHNVGAIVLQIISSDINDTGLTPTNFNFGRYHLYPFIRTLLKRCIWYCWYPKLYELRGNKIKSRANYFSDISLEREYKLRESN